MQQIETITFRNIEIRARVVHTWVVHHDFFFFILPNEFSTTGQIDITFLFCT